MKAIRTPITVKVAALLFLTVAISGAPVWSAIPAAMSTTDVLSKMEVRLLDHDYRSEPEAQRLERLEKFVFGGPETGGVKERVERLKAAIVPASAPASQPTASSQSSPAGAKSGDKTSAKSSKSSPVASSKTQPTTTYDPSDFGSYPRVAQLEQQFFNKTFTADPLPVRVARLETKEFGKSSPNEDLCDRMDRLDRIALKPSPQESPAAGNGAVAHSAYDGPAGSAPPGQHWVQYGFPPNITPFNQFADAKSDYPSDGSGESGKPAIENPFAPGSAKINGVEQRTATLEKFVFGHEHFGKPIAERVEKLEKKLVPYEHNGDKDIATRVDHLWTMLNAANTMNKSPVSTD